MLAERMGRSLGLPSRRIEAIARSASHRYKTYQVKKKRGGFREISHPSKVLKGLQRWLLHTTLDSLPVHPAAAGYVRGKNIADNAGRHVESRYLLRMDLLEFFPSITAQDIRSYVSVHGSRFPDWADEDVSLFCHIVCRHGKLTIGAPTSPALSNILCYDLDSKVSALADATDLSYTRYADDLFLSAKRPDILFGIDTEIENIVESIECPAGLRVNKAKTRHASKRGRRRVTGVTLGSDGRISVGRDVKREIRHLVFHLDSLDCDRRRYLAGRLAFVYSIEPDFINRLILKYGHGTVQKALRAP